MCENATDVLKEHIRPGSHVQAVINPSIYWAGSKFGITFNTVSPGSIMIENTGWAVMRDNDPNGYKNFTNNEWFFPIHFPGHPNVPGALQLEALAQMLSEMCRKLMQHAI